MLNLEQFYYQVVCTTPANDRYIVIQELEDVIVVNFDCLYERDCHIRGADQLIYLLHKMGANKRFLFLSEDGALLKLSTAVTIIENIRDCFALTADTCVVICREDLKIENVTVINNEAIPYWCKVIHPYVKDIPIPQGPFAKRFSCWFHRGTYYRLQLAKHLYENYREDSFISYLENYMKGDPHMRRYLADGHSWADANTPIIYGHQYAPNEIYDWELMVGAKRKPYNDYFMEIVGETDLLSTDWITEKTVKNLYIGKPFIVMGGAGTLEKIRSFGFKTFGPWIDESYDTITNNYQRLEAVKREIDRISTLDVNQIHQELMPILEYNRQVFLTHK